MVCLIVDYSSAIKLKYLGKVCVHGIIINFKLMSKCVMLGIMNHDATGANSGARREGWLEYKSFKAKSF
jgi:hypothetical protein